MTDLRAALGRTPAPSQGSATSSYPSTGRAGISSSTPLEHHGFTTAPNAPAELSGSKPAPPATFARRSSGSIEIPHSLPSSFATPESRQVSDGYSRYHKQPDTAQQFGVGMMAGSQQWQSGPTHEGRMAGNPSRIKQTSWETPATSNQPASVNEVLVGGGGDAGFWCSLWESHHVFKGISEICII